MDIRTSQVLTALDPLSVDLMLILLEAPLPETELIGKAAGATQPTGHRKMRRLANAGVVVQKDPAGRGQAWYVSAPAEVEAFIGALFDLVDALEQRAHKDRQESRRKLGAKRRGNLRVVGDEA